MNHTAAMSRLGRRGLIPAVSALAFLSEALLAPSGPAHAYTISSAVSVGCHEKMTSAALRAVRLELPTAAPLPADRNERALIDDVPFTLDDDMADLGGATLLLGVRDNDLKGRQEIDLGQLALVHGDPGAQREHCLRSSNADEPGGSEVAVLECRAFIRERVAQALGGLDATGTPDLANRTSIPVYLALRHRVDAALPTYYLRIGQALHAVEDSFTHTYRSADGTQITVVLNWIDQANGDLVEARDGPPHANELDRCDNNLDDLRLQRRQLATEAAAAILRATLDPGQTSDQKIAAVDAILDQVLGYAPGCTFGNDWCQAPERQYGNTQGGCGCGVGEPANRASITSPAFIAAALMLLTCARRRRRRRASVAVLAALIAGSLAGDARAESASKAAPRRAWGAHVGAAGSLDHGALAGALGACLRLRKYWTFGLDAEWNPWIAVDNDYTVRAGAFNAYATAILRVPLATERFDLRMSASLGMSRLLIDLYGAPAGSTGIFAGANPLGVEVELSPRLFLTLDPLGLAVAAPQLRGIPFAYWQYRSTLGLEAYFD
jgi:MYXO-CTERM domain-containing protein